MRFGLEDETIQLINRVFEKYPQVEKAIIYGSRAKGNFKPDSDIDLVLKGTGLNLSVMNKIRIDLDDLMLPYTIDVSNYDQINDKDLLAHIKRVGKVFYGAVI